MNEYAIINKTTILKRIEELEKDSIHSEWEHDVRTHNGHSAQQREKKNKIDLELNTLKEILSESTPLIPENIKPLQELVDRGYDPYDSGHHLQVQRMLKIIEQYISNLKLDI